MATLNEFIEMITALPEVTASTSRENPVYQVAGKQFVIFREPRKDAITETGELIPDLIAISVPDLATQAALLAGKSPWFLIDHFRGYKYVLIRAQDLAQVPNAELNEIVQEAWASRAPKKLVREFFG